MKSVTRAQADTWTYDWYDASNTKHTSKFIEVATDPYQMYELLRQVYMDKRFPGPTYTGYANNGTTREREVFYGQIAGGWSINAGCVSIYSTTGNMILNGIINSATIICW